MTGISAIQRQIQRLERRKQHCETVSRRYSWLRLAIVVTGGTAAWAAGSVYGTGAGWLAFSTAAVLFTCVVFLHRRLDHWSQAFAIWQAIYRENAARLTLDWEHIPLPVSDTSGPRSPLALDLDLTGPRSLHHLLDTTISRQGSRRLADWLTAGTPDPALILTRQSVVRELAAQPRFRHRLALIFRQLSRTPLDGDNLLAWLNTPYPEQRLHRVLPWAVLLVSLNLILFAVNAAGYLPPLWIVSGLAYTILYFANSQMINNFLTAVIRLDSELNTFQPLLAFLERYSYDHSPHLGEQCAMFAEQPNSPAQSLRRVRLVTVLVGLRSNQLLGPLLNMLTAWDFWTASLAARQRQQMSNLLPAWLDAFHELETLSALGDFAALHPEYAFPKVLNGVGVSGPVFNAAQLGHPLLSSGRKVPNDLQIDSIGSLFLITGSNMAGKSTFIRTVGVNLCLAYAGAPVDAAALQTLPFRLYTCIRINDSLEDGFSYFYAEVKRLKGLLDELASKTTSQPLLYLIDEIFRGTNNRERLIGSRAYVRALIGAPGVGLIATHDLELAALAAEHPLARNIHFRDEVKDGKLIFDYRLRPGPSPTTNALKIMELEGLPAVDIQPRAYEGHENNGFKKTEI